MINIIFIFIKFIVLILLIVSCGAFMSFFERRLLALFQNRYGPNRLGFLGILQIFADMLKILFKEDWIPNFSNKFFFVIAPIIVFVSSLLAFSIIPFNYFIFISNFDIGILFFFIMVSLNSYGIILAGWSSNNKYALLGAIRSIFQMLSYEIFLGISIMGIVLRASSFNLIEIVNSQKNIWNIFYQFLSFFPCFLSCIALCHRHPFDQQESEQELSGGYNIEYSGIKFGLFFIAEYINLITISSLIVILFFGGWFGPFLYSWIWFFLKVLFFVIFIILIRSSLSRPRYDKVIKFFWIFCLPIVLVNLLVTSIVILLKK